MPDRLNSHDGATWPRLYERERRWGRAAGGPRDDDTDGRFGIHQLTFDPWQIHISPQRDVGTAGPSRRPLLSHILGSLDSTHAGGRVSVTRSRTASWEMRVRARASRRNLLDMLDLHWDDGY